MAEFAQYEKAPLPAVEALSSEGAMGEVAAAICAPRVFPNGDLVATSVVTEPVN